MRCLALFALLAAASAVKITLRVFSGTENPSWEISSEQATQLDKMIATHTMNQNQYHIMGYTGFEYQGQILLGSPSMETYLLRTAPAGLLQPQVIAHVRDRIFEAPKKNAHIFSQHPYALNATATCTPKVVGPDTVPVYDPNADDSGCFVQMCTDNNCYNYGNDIVTNTFAQPGRGSGHKWVSDNCSSVTVAAQSDGLVWAGTTLPTSHPPKGHYAAMLIWPQTNFHWIRMDASNYWSHKPGQTPVRDIDDNGNKITDPSKADFAPWTQFCGYFVTVPSTVTIN